MRQDKERRVPHQGMRQNKMPGEGDRLMRKPRATAATSGPDGLAPAGDVAAIVPGTHGDPFAVLGVQE
ncbi:hypothetical protein EN766_39095, partial [Mesorhizobium sp. M2A.F.Ca.ET.046.02.1.1]